MRVVRNGMNAPAKLPASGDNTRPLITADANQDKRPIDGVRVYRDTTARFRA